ncbi:16S rRNA (adenine(1518)-N(6)/adenine(1519)-N(6))-dimethyltransferase RsmA [Kangiella sp. HZ709]|uniref:16S rRNA (adenine(1518)-N(6)/adenine(1519)-N(6))- dimethyltransferase RsmA n=1 Tax=Kangiella sp. HZ709 TaxID=2666328 RepID=UPI0012AF2BA7|nr:16S rRNA (adenine(1518)-N(6)/adenine(1519)-N(6))-dimethyltransferase RsmA [Kangiella sp. HZ709]MRX27617.1 16S rRNA (adenine(1518)-N(6)/adenine(1519)-N(6))-dimethyltransferase RsmA [Kangiella sp. HZ709]
MAKKNSSIVQGHQARKRFGQNFLSDNFYINRIVDSIAPTDTDFMVEIGPGLGAITELLISKVKQLDLVELDKDLIPRLEDKFATANNLQIHHSDALKFDFSSLTQTSTNDSTSKLRIVGNLPYNISTPLIFHLLNFRAEIKDMYFMLQKEVVERICAKPNTKAYGRLSVMTQYYCETEMLFTVPPGAFQPAPKVDSAIIKLSPKAESLLTATDTKLLAEVVTSSFNQRRKTIRNNLKKYLTDDQLESLSIDPSVRPETLPIENFISIANWLAKH